MIELGSHKGNPTLTIRVIPNAKCAKLHMEGDMLKCRVVAPPVDGAANKALRIFLARTVFGISRSAVTISRGKQSRTKTVSIELTPSEVLNKLSAFLK